MDTHIDVAIERPSRPGLEAAALDSSQLTVLQAVMGHDEPLTAGRIARATGVLPAQVAAALATLCQAGLLRRLNTLVVSYTARY